MAHGTDPANRLNPSPDPLAVTLGMICVELSRRHGRRGVDPTHIHARIGWI